MAIENRFKARLKSERADTQRGKLVFAILKMAIKISSRKCTYANKLKTCSLLELPRLAFKSILQQIQIQQLYIPTISRF